MKRGAWIAVLLASLGTAGAVADDKVQAGEEVRQLQAQVLPCFNAPPDATGPATIAFTLDAAGGFALAPAVVEKTPGEANAAFAAAALRAVVRCSPFRGVKAQTVRMIFRPNAL